MLLDTERDGRRCFCTEGTETLMLLEALEKQGRVRLGEYDGRRISCYLTTEGETQPEARTRLRFPTPAGSCWDDVLIRIVSEKGAFIQVKDTNQPFNFIEMGFQDRRDPTSPKPDRRWRLLKALADHRGSTRKRSEITVRNWGIATKQVQELNKALKEIFGIEGRPISLVKDQGSFRYETIFRLESQIPDEPDSTPPEISR